nr:MAG TPA: hypothetical protein [Caudoviricetes sp.]
MFSIAENNVINTQNMRVIFIPIFKKGRGEKL